MELANLHTAKEIITLPNQGNTKAATCSSKQLSN